MATNRTIEQTVTFHADCHEVYEALMDSAKHAQFTGAEANISREGGGNFTAYGGALSGTNIELIPDQKIVQFWRAADENWPDEHYSQVTFTLEGIGGGTRLSFVQTDVPAACYDSISQGWHDYYWTGMKKLLESCYPRANIWAQARHVPY